MDFQTHPIVCKYMVDLLPVGVVTVLEPTPGIGNLVNALSGYRVTVPLDFFDVSGCYDAVVMNPPFSPMDIGYQILDKTMGMSDIIIALMPWLTLINSKKRTHDIKSYGLKSVSHLPRDVFKGSRVQTCVLEMARGYAGSTAFLFPEFSLT